LKGLCEICGSDRYEVSPVIFEGSRVLACKKCIKSLSLTPIKPRAEVEAKILSKPLKKPSRRRSIGFKEEYTLVEGYGMRVRAAREERGLTQEDLAKLINEKVSLIKKVEGEKIIPPPALIKKLEHVLKVKILEKVEEEAVPLEEPSIERPSLGDIAVFKGGEE